MELNNIKCCSCSGWVHASSVRKLLTLVPKAERQARSDGPSSELDDVPVAMPALTRARKIQKRAARVGFDWPDAAGARAKLDEELRELDTASDVDARAEELGDLLFSAVNLARHLDIDPEGALRADATTPGSRSGEAT